MLLRICRRRTSWESETDLETTFRTEFCRDGLPDLRLSVYEIDEADDVVRSHAEHSASANADPPSGSTNVDLYGHPKVQVVTGASAFQFTRQRHREMVFTHEQELRNFVAFVRANFDGRAYPTKKKQLLDYARERMATRDQEWIDFCNESPKAKKWKCPDQSS